MYHVANEEVNYIFQRTANIMIKDGRIDGAVAEIESVCKVCQTAEQIEKTFFTNEVTRKARERARLDRIVCSDVI